mgnify:CR=1 FL=1
MLTKIRNILLGKPRDPFDRETRHSISLIAFLAWIGLGADGISSSCYGPEEAFLALGKYNSLAIYLAIATAITVFIISVSTFILNGPLLFGAFIGANRVQMVTFGAFFAATYSGFITDNEVIVGLAKTSTCLMIFGLLNLLFL